MYGDSLKFVNGLLTVKFGPESRRVPSHMPHMIDKELVEEMQNTYFQIIHFFPHYFTFKKTHFIL